jgi:GH18 family chitinase
MGYVDVRGLGGAFVWAVKDDDANGRMVKTMAEVLGIH